MSYLRMAYDRISTMSFLSAIAGMISGILLCVASDPSVLGHFTVLIMLLIISALSTMAIAKAANRKYARLD